MNRKNSLIDAIFSLDPRIRFACITDQLGKRFKGHMRPGKASLNPGKDEQKLIMQTAVSLGISETWSKHFDSLRFSIFLHDKLTTFQFPLGNKILIVTSEPDTPLDTANKIEKLLRSSRNFALK